MHAACSLNFCMLAGWSCSDCLHPACRPLLSLSMGMQLLAIKHGHPSSPELPLSCM